MDRLFDSDDAWTEDKLEKQLTRAASMRGEFIFSGSAFMDADGNRKVGLLHVPEQVTYKELLKQNVISCSSVMIKKVWFADIKWRETFCMKILQCGFKF